MRLPSLRRRATGTLKKPRSALAATLGAERVKPILRRPGAWPFVVIAITLLAVAVRAVIVADSHGGSNLAIYTYFSRLALHGTNPFNPPLHGAINPVHSNSPPFEVAVFTGLLAIHDSPTMLRALFVLGDVAVLLLIGFAFPRPRRWRLGFMLFYAFNPFVLVAWTVYAQDKTLLFFGIAALLLALERGREWTGWLAATALAAFKFLGAFGLPELALHWYRKRRWWALAPVLAFVLVVALSNLPWFPKSLDAFTRRNDLLAINPPIHAAPTIVLARLGIYAPIEAKLLPVAAAIVVLILFARRWIDVREAMVWSLFAGYVFLPDTDFDRMLLIALPFLLLLDLSLARWVVIWVVSSVSALAGLVATHGMPHALAGVAGTLHSVFAGGGTLRYVLWLNLLPALVLGYYCLDRRAGRAPAGTLTP
jgi:hypothetical protein